MTELIDFLIQLNQSGLKIPLEITQTTTSNWPQFTMTLVMGIIGSAFMIFIFWGSLIQPQIGNIISKLTLRKIRKVTGRNILFIKHTQQGIFSQSMITQNTMLDISKAFRKFDGKPFDLILHTPGGEVFSSMFISRMLKSYKGNIRSFVPFYAMSGGSLLALSGNDIYLSKNGCIGCIDPQVGMLWNYGSTSSWNRIMKVKGKEANDSSIGLAFLGSQCTKTIKNYLVELLEDKMSKKENRFFVEFLTSGKVEHIYPLGINELKSFGLDVKPLDDKIAKYLERIVSSKMFEGVYYL